MSPWIDVDPQTQQIAPASLSYHNPRQLIFSSPPTHAASSAMPYERSLTVVLGYRRLVFIVSGYRANIEHRRRLIS